MEGTLYEGLFEKIIINYFSLDPKIEAINLLDWCMTLKLYKIVVVCIFAINQNVHDKYNRHRIIKTKRLSKDTMDCTITYLRWIPVHFVKFQFHADLLLSKKIEKKLSRNLNDISGIWFPWSIQMATGLGLKKHESFKYYISAKSAQI